MTDRKDMEAVRVLLDRNRAALMARHDAAGVGIGRDEGGCVIVVYLKSEEHRSSEEATLEGVPLKFIVTGPFTIRR